jgi:hypothetical protein
MSAFVGGVPARFIFSAARACVIGLAVVVSGCAANKQPSYVNGPYPYPGTMPQRVAAEAAPVPVKTEIEDDGLPAQTPGRRMRPEEDDPSQPWSPNYGRGTTLGARPAMPADRALPGPAPVLSSPPPVRQHEAAARPRAQAALSETAADAIIARAVSAHEQRYR